MKLIATVADPDFATVKRSPCIDFVKFFSDSFTKPPIDAERCKCLPHAGLDGFGMQVTIQNPQPRDIEIALAHMSKPRITELEVSLDFRPRGDLLISDRRRQMEEIRQWLLAHLYPWDAPGIQPAHRVSRKRGHSEPVVSDEIIRRAERNETLYFGHAKGRYADPDEDNFAFMRLYEKKTDNRGTLPPVKTSIRVEVNLNEAGCRNFGLVTPDTLRGFNFRNLSEYFRLVKPAIWLPRATRLRAESPKLAALLEAKIASFIEQRAITAGAWALHGVRRAVPNVNRHAVGNRMIGTMLDNLTKKYRRGR